MAKNLRWTMLIGATVVVGGLLGGCSSDSKSTSTTAAVTSPEEHLADDATVTAGLGRMVTTAGTVSTTVAGGTKVSDAGDQLEPDIYLSIEDAITALDTAAADGDAAATAKASTDLSTAIANYLAKHP